MNRKLFTVFFIIFFLACLLRLYRLSDIPPGVNRDEASIGYTAYSLLQTGKDEYERAWPISFQSFGDWKLPLYMYVTVPFISIFGLSELAVRLPSALFGIATVALTFFLVKQLFNNTTLSFVTMFLVAISPWHLHLSRVESEANTAVFLTTLAILLFLKSLKVHTWLIIPSALFFSLTYFTYAGNYIFTTLLIVGIVFIYRNAIPKTKYLFIGSVLFFLLSSFITFHTVFGNTTKVSGIGIFGDPSVVHTKIELPRNQHDNPRSIISRVLHNRVVFASERFFQNYLNAFSPQFLFIKGGDNRAHNIANFGNMYLWEAPFLFLGIVYLLFFKKGREKQLIIFWFFMAPIAASITKDAPHTNRMFTIFPILAFVTAIGIEQARTYLMVNGKWFTKMIIAIAAIVFCLNIGIYLDRYFVHFPKSEGEHWGIGYKRLSEIITSQKYRDKKIVMTRPEYSPYIFLLFYQKYDPSRYQKATHRYPPTEDGFVHVEQFDRYEFRDIDWEKDLSSGNKLLIVPSHLVPASVREKYTTVEIELLNNQSMFTIVEIK